MLIISNATIVTGVWHYYDNRLKGDVRRVLGLYSFVLFVAIFAAFYIVRCIRDKYSLGHVETPDIKDKDTGKMRRYTTD